MSEGNGSAWRTIHQDLKAQIRDGKLRPGSALPTQSDLASRYRVGRHMVRRAITALAEERLVVSWQGKGAFVSESRIPYRISDRTRFGDNMLRVGRLSDVRLVGIRRRPTLDPVACLLGVTRRDPVLVGELLRLVDGLPTMLARHYYDPRRFPTIFEDIERTGSVTKAFRASGVMDYLRAQTIVETRMPTAHETSVLEIPPSQPVLVVTGQNTDAQGTPLEVSQAVWRGDRIQVLI